MNNKKYYGYITGLKGIACFGVMAGHFFAALKNAGSPPFSMLPLFQFMGSPLGFLIDEAFWLYLFFVVSGFLLAQSTITSVYSLIEKVIKRFLRLALPILFASVGIYVIIRLFGVYCDELGVYFDNTWLQEFYVYPIARRRVILAPFDVLLKGDASINSVYWVLKDMLRASLLIYFFMYIRGKLPDSLWCNLLLSGVSLYISGRLSIIVLACTFGMVIAIFQNNADKLLKKAPWFGAVILAILMGYYINSPTMLTKIVLFGVVILVVPCYRVIDRFLSAGIPLWLGKISFGIYSFHWPIFCSIGSFVLLKLFPKVGIIFSFSASFLISMVLTLVISQIYFLTAEKYAGILTQWLTDTVLSVLKPKKI